jgi:RNA polymerase subunit RPABC4/transcription elongation factor Spt4
MRLFDLDADGQPDTDAVPTPAGQSIDDILASIVGDEGVRQEILEELRGTEDVEDETAAGERVVFECPACGTEVDAEAATCPGCGAQFAQEAVEQFECPLCHAIVDGAATQCPGCGAEFADGDEPEAVAEPHEEPPEEVPVPEVEPPPAPPRKAPPPSALAKRLARARKAGTPVPTGKATTKDLPRLVSEVKPLLLAAKKAGVDIGECKNLINDAIVAGKGKDIPRAVRLVAQAKAALHAAFTERVADALEALLLDIERAKVTGSDVHHAEVVAAEAVALLDAKDCVTAWERANAAREEFEKRAGGFHRGRQALADLQGLIDDARLMVVDTREAEAALREAREALDRRDWDAALAAVESGKERLLRDLPDRIDAEMKDARNVLLDLKVRGGDLTKPIGILKQASIHLKRREYGDAIRYVRMFQQEIKGP